MNDSCRSTEKLNIITTAGTCPLERCPKQAISGTPSDQGAELAENQCIRLLPLSYDPPSIASTPTPAGRLLYTHSPLPLPHTGLVPKLKRTQATQHNQNPTRKDQRKQSTKHTLVSTWRRPQQGLYTQKDSWGLQAAYSKKQRAAPPTRRTVD